MIAVEFFGVSKLGAQRWLELPFLGFTIQPSEIIKPSFILMLAYLIRQSPPPPEGYGFKSFVQLSLYILLPFSLVVVQPDLGTASILLIVGFGILLMVGVRPKIWVILGSIFIIASPLIYTQMLHDYQKKRIKDFLSEKPSYHVKQSIIAVGNGGLLGKDKEKATQSHLKFLPIATSDFLFAYFMERYGFVGAIGLILIYIILILHIFSLQFLDHKDYFLKVFACGVSLLIFIYMSINIAMIIGFFPVVGVPLPFFSYGGSSFMTFVILIAILENLLAFRFIFMYNFNS